MSSLIRQASVQPTTPRPDQTLNSQVADAERVGIVAVARLQAAAFAASVAMQSAVMLSRSANAAFKVSPMGEDIYQSILMAYGTVAVTEVQGLSLKGQS